MRSPLDPESALGIITILVGAPVAATLLYIIGYSFTDIVMHPLKYWFMWGFFVGWAIAAMKAAFKLFRHWRSTRNEAVV